MISIFLMFSNLKQKISAVIYHFIFNRETWLQRFAIDQNSCLFDWLRGEHPVKKQSSCLEYWMNMCWICNLSNILNLIIHIYRIFLCRKILKSVFIWYVRDMMNTKVAKLQILMHKTLCLQYVHCFWIVLLSKRWTFVTCRIVYFCWTDFNDFKYFCKVLYFIFSHYNHTMISVQFSLLCFYSCQPLRFLFWWHKHRASNQELLVF